MARWPHAHGAHSDRLRRDVDRDQDRDILQRRQGRRSTPSGVIADVRAGRQIKGGIREACGLIMPFAIIDGIATRYEVVGAGPPLLMYAPGGFDAMIENWSTQSIYAKIKPLDHCRNTSPASCSTGANAASPAAASSASPGRTTSPGQGPARSSGIARAHLMGGCMGCRAGHGVRRRASGDDCEHGAVLAGRRREIPHVGPAAVRRTPRLRAAARPRRASSSSSGRTANRSAPIRAADHGPP